MKRPLVSVIIPTYNRADLLPNCTNSILNQSYQKFELLIIDDGSTDNTKGVVKKIKDKRVKYFYKKNEGASSAQNFGVRKSRGKYVMILADDDAILPEKIKLQVDYLERNDKLSFCYSNIIINFKGNKKIYHNKIYENNYLNLLLNKSFISIPSVLFRGKIIRKFSFDESLPVAEDYDLLLNITKNNNKFGYINKPLVTVNKHQGNLSNDIARMSYYESLVKIRHLKSLHPEEIKKLKDRYIQEYNYQSGRNLLLKSDYQKSRKYLKKTIKNNSYHYYAQILLLLSYIKSTQILKMLLLVNSKLNESLLKKYNNQQS